MAKLWIFQDCLYCGNMTMDWPDNSPHAGMRPNNVSFRMAREYSRFDPLTQVLILQTCAPPITSEGAHLGALCQ